MIMNKLTKIGASALCGSLVAMSAANAGSLSVAGGAAATWTSNEGTVTGNPLGVNSGFTFTGSGELDGGTAVTLTITQTDASGLSAANINMDVPGLGGIKINAKSGGTGIDIIDDKMPTAWEETNGTGLGTGLQTVAGAGGGINIGWSLSPDFLPEGLSVDLAYAPKMTSGATADKGQGGDTAGTGSAWDVVVQHSNLMDGLNLFAGMSTIEQIKQANNYTGDRSQYAWGATYAIGGFTLGYQESRDNLQSAVVNSASYYDNEAWGVSFNVNDDLVISYGVHDSTVKKNSGTSTTNSAESIQMSYTMGGATFVLAESSVDNANYSSGTASDRDGTTLRLSLAF
jgi:hypothetical protein